MCTCIIIWPTAPLKRHETYVIRDRMLCAHLIHRDSQPRQPIIDSLLALSLIGLFLFPSSWILIIDLSLVSSQPLETGLAVYIATGPSSACCAAGLHTHTIRLTFKVLSWRGTLGNIWQHQCRADHFRTVPTLTKALSKGHLLVRGVVDINSLIQRQMACFEAAAFALVVDLLVVFLLWLWSGVSVTSCMHAQT